jgi:preprotein translocase subunit SecD
MPSSNKYQNVEKKRNTGRPIRMFLFIIFIFVFTALYNLPKMTPNLNIAGQKITTVGGYNIDLPFFKKDMSLKKGLDLQGGVQLTLQADMKDIEGNDREQALQSARDVIERRVNLYGVSEPVVQSSKAGNDYRVIVELPGVTDVNEALALVGKTAKLEFREPVESTAAAETTIASPSSELSATTSATTDSSSESAQLQQLIDQLNSQYRPTALTGKDLKRATVSFNPQTGEPQVDLEFKDNGAKLFSELTTKYLGQNIAIYLDDEMISAPTVRTPITDGRANISGGFTVAQAQQFATQLNAGALPVPVSVIEQRTIGATLGNESVNRSIVAGVIGVSVVAIFMIALYGIQGLLADIALLLYALISLFIFRFIPITLTLAGIAGFILSIGMATDANILIFERMREEMRWGKSRRDALRLGFERAWSSIWDSNVSSLITCFILYSFGTGLIRGFALTLAIGIAVSMFTAITVSRTLLRMMNK